jgi:hypothetical protein
MGGAPASCNDPLKMPRKWGCFWDDFAKDGDGWGGRYPLAEAAE